MTSPRSLPKPKKPKLLLVRRVAGDSMLPTLRAGQLVIAVRPYRLRAGMIVIVYHQGLEKIKRITHIDSGKLFVEGDNAGSSTDSRSFGWLSVDVVIGKVIWPQV